MLKGSIWRPVFRFDFNFSNIRTVKTLCYPGQPQNDYDAIIVGAGHNGLVAAGYLQQAGINVCVLERRPVIGGAAVTEEMVPGFKFSRASYLLSLLRPSIIRDLKLKVGLPTTFTLIAFWSIDHDRSTDWNSTWETPALTRRWLLPIGDLEGPSPWHYLMMWTLARNKSLDFLLKMRKRTSTMNRCSHEL